MKNIVKSIIKSVSSIYSLLRDPEVSRKEFESMTGRKDIAIIIKINIKSNNKYIVIESSGGESKVFVPLELSTCSEMFEFISSEVEKG